jgi:uncharacterized ubiquitin-like protein YukD
LEIEKNVIDYPTLQKLIQALIDANKITMLNLSQCEIDDKASKLICHLLKDAI